MVLLKIVAQAPATNHNAALWCVQGFESVVARQMKRLHFEL